MENQIQPLIDALANTPNLIIPLIRETPSDLLRRRPTPIEWSAHEHACHLAAVHQLFFTRLDLMLRENHPTIKPYFPDVDDPEDALLNMDLETALAQFTADRAALVAKLRELSPADWQHTADHPEYSEYSVFIMFRHLLFHDMAHAYQIEALRLQRDGS